MDGDPPVPDTRVLAIASHVTYGYVGNKMATFVMQAMGCDVSVMNTVNFSNHTAYKQFKGRKTTAEELAELYEGLKLSDLNHFDMMLSGYTGSKEAVEIVGQIGRDQRHQASKQPGSFFWILDPVMGDEGRLYVAEDIVPVYKSLLKDADLILPNCFEAELLADAQITDVTSLSAAITKLHKTYQVPNIVVTSVRISKRTGQVRPGSSTITVFGSTCRQDFSPRLFSVVVPSLPVFFSGTGDMFAALMLSRLREAVSAVSPKLLERRSWRPDDDVDATSLPLARAVEKTLASMHTILVKTLASRDKELSEEVVVNGGNEEDEKRMHLRRTRASEVRVVRYAQDLRDPKLDELKKRGITFVAEAVGDGRNIIKRDGEGTAVYV